MFTSKQQHKRIVDTRLLSQTSIEQARLKYIANQEKQKQLRRSLPPIAKRVSQNKRCVSVQAPKIIYSKFYYYVGEGNNDQLVCKLLNERHNWVQVKDPKSKKINFKWQETLQGYEYKTVCKEVQMLNHFEFHNEISDKYKMALNFKHYCDKYRLNSYDYIPTTFAIECNHENLRSELFQFISFYRQNCPPQKLNDLDKSIKLNNFHYTTLYDSKVTHYPTLFGNENLWIFKPSNMNQGRGIHVVRSLDDILETFNKYQGGYKEKLLEVKRNENNEIINKVIYLNTLITEQYVIQKYIEKPLLINERKFDVRAYALLTSKLQLYFYREGQLRLATEKFDAKQQSNYVHLTNNAIQYTHPEYGRTEEGNQFSFDQAQSYFQKDQKDFRNEIIPKLRNVTQVTFQTVKHKINKQKRKFCFEIFGMDFIMDETYTPWLIEVNTNPSLEVTSKLLGSLFPRMLSDAFKLTIDINFPQTNYQPYQLMNYGNDENLWDCLGYLQS